MAFFCLFVLFVVFLFLKRAGIKYANRGQYIMIRPATIMAFLLFSIFVGLRYNPVIDVDFMNYWWTAEFGREFHEYDRFELFPRILVDIVQYFHWSPSSWFFMMGAFLIGFTCFAASRISNSFLCYTYLGLILLYLSFDMNVMRQGVALSVFLCACTYISEKDWKHYVLFMAIAYGFHSSAILWSPIYILTFLNWNKRRGIKYLLVIVVFVAAEVSLVYLINRFSFIFGLMGKDSAAVDGEIDMLQSDNIGSGVGVIIRYVRWVMLLYVLPKLAYMRNDRNLSILIAIFLIGVVMDPFSMYAILTQRVSFYPQVVEILLYPYLLDYIKINRQSGLIIYGVLWLQLLFLTYVLCGYLDKWQFV